MNVFLVILFIVAVIVLIFGGFVASIKFLLWVGLVVAIVAAIIWVLRMLTGRRS
jgi:hypothetical protein